MLPRFILKPCRAGYKAVASLARNRAAKLKGQMSQSGDKEPAAPESDKSSSSGAWHGAEEGSLPLSPAMRDILAERPGILVQIGWMAEQGVVVDGPPLRLRANHEAELAEHRCLLVGDRLTLQAGLLHLEGLFPPLPEPEPQPPLPPRRRYFPPLGDLLAQRPKRPLH